MPLDILSKSYLFVKQYWPCWWWLFVDARNFPMPNQIYSDIKQRSIGPLEVKHFMHDVLNIMLNCSTWTSTLLLILGLQLLLNRVKALAFACLPNMWHLLHVTKADSSYWNVTIILHQTTPSRAFDFLLERSSRRFCLPGPGTTTSDAGRYSFTAVRPFPKHNSQCR